MCVCQLDDLTPLKYLEVVLVIPLGEGELVFFLRHSGKPLCSAFNTEAGSALLPGLHYELLCLSRSEALSRVESQIDTQKCAPRQQKTVCGGTASKGR